jgi:restriction endonuclease S subunit
MTATLCSSIETQMKELFNTSLKTSDYTYCNISSFCSFEKSKIAATKNIVGDYPFISLKTSTHNVKTLDDSEHVFISGIPQGNRLMKVKFHKGECAYSSLMFHCKLDTNVILPKFFYNYLRFNMDILNEYVIGVQPKFSYESFLTRKIIIPSLNIQQTILNHINIMEQTIETFERLTNETDEKAKFVMKLYMSSSMLVADNTHENN